MADSNTSNTPADAEAAECIKRDAGVLANKLVAEVPFVEWKHGDREPLQPSQD